jgi:chromate transporter
MDKKKRSLNSNIFWTLLKINALTFGGGYTIIPIIRQEMVENQKLLSDDDMLDIIAIAESGPGAMAISTSYLTGLKINGIKGGLAAVLGSLLPPLVVITSIFFIYHKVVDNIYVRAALRGMSGVIVAMLMVSCKELFLASIKSHKILSLSLMAFAFVLSFWNLIPVAAIILILALIGILSYGYVFPARDRKKEGGKEE